MKMTRKTELDDFVDRDMEYSELVYSVGLLNGKALTLGYGDLFESDNPQAKNVLIYAFGNKNGIVNRLISNLPKEGNGTAYNVVADGNEVPSVSYFADYRVDVVIDTHERKYGDNSFRNEVMQTFGSTTQYIDIDELGKGYDHVLSRIQREVIPIRGELEKEVGRSI